MLTVIMLVVSFISLSSVMVSNMLFNTYTSLANQKLERSISASKNYIHSVMLSVHNLSLNNIIVSDYKNNGATITNMLDNACSYAKKVNAISVYYLSGEVFTSTGISSVPTLQDLRQNERINDFLVLENSDYISLRVDSIIGNYFQAPYDQSKGMVSCCQKIYNIAGEVIGYIFADIFPSNLYNYFDYGEDSGFHKSIPIMQFDEKYFKYEENSNYLDDFTKNQKDSFKSSDGKLLIIPSQNNFFGGKITVAVPLFSVQTTIIDIIFSMVIAAFIIILVVHFITKTIAESMNKRLVKLLDKMENEGFIA